MAQKNALRPAAGSSSEVLRVVVCDKVKLYLCECLITTEKFVTSQLFAKLTSAKAVHGLLRDLGNREPGSKLTNSEGLVVKQGHGHNNNNNNNINDNNNNNDNDESGNAANNEIIEFDNASSSKYMKLRFGNYDERIAQVKALLTPADFDDVAINRSSLGFCGFICCGNSVEHMSGKPAPMKMLVQMIINEQEIDKDVISSFCSFECFGAFKLIRQQLSEAYASFRTKLPSSLVNEFLIANPNMPPKIHDAIIGVLEKPEILSCSSPTRKIFSDKVSEKLSNDDAGRATDAAKPVCLRERSHPAKKTDADSGSGKMADWKLLSKKQVSLMANSPEVELTRFEYDDAENDDNDGHDVECFTDLNDLANWPDSDA